MKKILYCGLLAAVLIGLSVTILAINDNSGVRVVLSSVSSDNAIYKLEFQIKFSGEDSLIAGAAVDIDKHVFKLSAADGTAYPSTLEANKTLYSALGDTYYFCGTNIAIGQTAIAEFEDHYTVVFEPVIGENTYNEYTTLLTVYFTPCKDGVPTESAISYTTNTEEANSIGINYSAIVCDGTAIYLGGNDVLSETAGYHPLSHTIVYADQNYVTRLAKYYAGHDTEVDLSLADADNNGRITRRDVMILARYIEWKNFKLQ